MNLLFWVVGFAVTISSGTKVYAIHDMGPDSEDGGRVLTCEALVNRQIGGSPARSGAGRDRHYNPGSVADASQLLMNAIVDLQTKPGAGNGHPNLRDEIYRAYAPMLLSNMILNLKILRDSLRKLELGWFELIAQGTRWTLNRNIVYILNSDGSFAKPGNADESLPKLKGEVGLLALLNKVNSASAEEWSRMDLSSYVAQAVEVYSLVTFAVRVFRAFSRASDKGEKDNLRRLLIFTEKWKNKASSANIAGPEFKQHSKELNLHSDSPRYDSLKESIANFEAQTGHSVVFVPIISQKPMELAVYSLLVARGVVPYFLLDSDIGKWPRIEEFDDFTGKLDPFSWNRLSSPGGALRMMGNYLRRAALVPNNELDLSRPDSIRAFFRRQGNAFSSIFAQVEVENSADALAWTANKLLKVLVHMPGPRNQEIGGDPGARDSAGKFRTDFSDLEFFDEQEAAEWARVRWILRLADSPDATSGPIIDFSRGGSGEDQESIDVAESENEKIVRFNNAWVRAWGAAPIR